MQQYIYLTYIEKNLFMFRYIHVIIQDCGFYND